MRPHHLLVPGLLLVTSCAEFELNRGDQGASAPESARDTGNQEADADTDYDGDDTEWESETEQDFLMLAPATTDAYVFVANPDRDTVTRVAVPSLEVITVDVGVSPSVAVTTADYSKAVVFNEGSDDVSILDADTLDEVRVEVREHLNSMELDDQARGSIRLGERTLLFQLVQAPPVGMRELERPSFRPKLMNQDDPVFMGFLGLFTVMAGMFAAYVSAVQTPELVTDFQEVERFAVLHLPPPEPIEIKPEPAPPPVNDGAGQPVPPKPTPKPEVADAGEPQPGEVRRPRTAEEAMALATLLSADAYLRPCELLLLYTADVVPGRPQPGRTYRRASRIFRDGSGFLSPGP